LLTHHRISRSPERAGRTAAVSQRAAGDPFAHQLGRACTGRAVRRQPIRGGPDHPSPGGGGPAHSRPALLISNHPWVIDGILIPIHDQSVTAIRKNYGRSINTQIIVCARLRHVVVVSRCWPGNRNDVIVARATVAHLLTGHQEILGDGGFRGITSIITLRRDHCGRIIRMTTTGSTAESGPASNKSSPGSPTGRYCGNAATAATPSITAFKSSPDSGT
jgi:hypothetical protein